MPAIRSAAPINPTSRTALLLRCSPEEAGTIRDRAESERRSVSGSVLNIVMRALHFEEKVLATGRFRAGRRPSSPVVRQPGPRTAVLVRCSRSEAMQIRATAKRKQLTISGYILQALRRSWAATVAPQ